MKATVTMLLVLVLAGLGVVVLETADGTGDWIELGAIALAAVVLGVAAGRGSPAPRRRIRGFVRTPESDW